MFDKCPVCNDSLIEFLDHPNSFVCKSKHIISVRKDFIEIRFDDCKFTIQENEISFSFIKLGEFGYWTLKNYEQVKLQWSQNMGSIILNFYPDCSDMPKLLKKIHILKVFQ